MSSPAARTVGHPDVKRPPVVRVLFTLMWTVLAIFVGGSLLIAVLYAIAGASVLGGVTDSAAASANFAVLMGWKVVVGGGWAGAWLVAIAILRPGAGWARVMITVLAGGWLLVQGPALWGGAPSPLAVYLGAEDSLAAVASVVVTAATSLVIVAVVVMVWLPATAAWCRRPRITQRARHHEVPER